MPITVLGRQIPDKASRITYRPLKKTGFRIFRILNSTNTIGGAVTPVLMVDEDVAWSPADVNKGIVDAVSNAGYRDFAQNGRALTGQKGINPTVWETLTPTAYEDTEMIGVMLAKLDYPNVPTTWVVSAAPNMIWISGKTEGSGKKESSGGKPKSGKKGSSGKKPQVDEEDEKAPKQVNEDEEDEKGPVGVYGNHLSEATRRGQANEGGSIHFELFMIAQLAALLDRIYECDKKNFDVKKVSADLDLYLSGKNVICKGCAGALATFGKTLQALKFRPL
jgi:hypothetical protein